MTNDERAKIVALVNDCKIRVGPVEPGEELRGGAAPMKDPCVMALEEEQAKDIYAEGLAVGMKMGEAKALGATVAPVTKEDLVNARELANGQHVIGPDSSTDIMTEVDRRQRQCDAMEVCLDSLMEVGNLEPKNALNNVTRQLLNAMPSLRKCQGYLRIGLERSLKAEKRG